MKVAWVLCCIAQVIAGAMLVLTLLASSGAPQEAAGAAMAAVVSIVPYCFARAVTEISHLNEPRRK